MVGQVWAVEVEMILVVGLAVVELVLVAVGQVEVGMTLVVGQVEVELV